MFDGLPYSTPQKVGIIVAGFFVGIGYAALTSAALLCVGIALSLMGNAGWLSLGEYQAWLPIIGLEYGFVLGLPIGTVMCWKFCKSRLVHNK